MVSCCLGYVFGSLDVTGNSVRADAEGPVGVKTPWIRMREGRESGEPGEERTQAGIACRRSKAGKGFSEASGGGPGADFWEQCALRTPAWL